MIRLLIVDDIASTRDNLRKLLGFEEDIEVIGTAGDGKQGLEEAHRLLPDIVLTDVNMPIMDGIQLTERLAQELPASPVIIMSVQGERDYLRRAMQAGAREYLIKPFSHDELVAAIRRVHQLEEKKGTFARAAAPDTSGAPRAAALGEVIVLFSGKGGVGKTLLATNLSVALAVETESRVALVDLDLQFGDIGVMLNLDHSRSITDVVDSETLEPEMLNEIMAHGPAGVRVLLAPISPELADLITNDHVRMVMTELRKTYDYVVVDTSCHLADFNLEVIESRAAHPRRDRPHDPGDQGREARAQGARVADGRSRVRPARRRSQRRALGLQQGIDRAEPAPRRRRADSIRPAGRRRLDQPRDAVRDGQPRVRYQPFDSRARRRAGAGWGGPRSCRRRWGREGRRSGKKRRIFGR